jgi:hypothetical protein
MHPLHLHYWVLALLAGMIMSSDLQAPVPDTGNVRIVPHTSFVSAEPGCNCTITQGGNSYPITALEHDQTAVAFYSYGNPNGTSANTGLEAGNAMVLFLYEDTTTTTVSLFIILDIANDGTGGEADAEISCLPPEAFVSLGDEPGELSGVPPLIVGDWFWSSCCTDGGIIEDVGCVNTFNVDLLVSTGIDSIVWLTGDVANPSQILLAMSGEAVTLNCGGGVCCPQGFDTDIVITDATCDDSANGAISLTPEDGLPQYVYNWSTGAGTQSITDLVPGTYLVTITDAQGCSEELSIIVGVAPGDPPAIPATLELCTDLLMDFFDLTTIENVVNQGSGFDVLWFENSDMTGAIGNPSSYFSGSATIYAVVDNGSCLSDPVAVML